jgi:hypothetical protein
VNVVPLPPADLVVSAVVAPVEVFDGATIEVRYRVTNLGAGETDQDGWIDTVWLTRDKNHPAPGTAEQPNDYLIGTFAHSGSLKVGEFYEQLVTVRLPARLTGQWFITPFADSLDSVAEDTFSDNINPDDPNEIDNNNYKARPITILLTPPPDLVVTNMLAPAAESAGENYTVRWTVQNQGSGVTAEERWTDSVFLASSPDLQAPNTRALLLGKIGHEGALGVGQSYTIEQTFLLSPSAEGQFVIVVTDSAGQVFEGVSGSPLENNNSLSRASSVTGAPADLRVVSVETPAQSARRRLWFQAKVTQWSAPSPYRAASAEISLSIS